uniref:Uncharacterized protein n=1 Tax=Anguilla anguilla TaxID=7936 RepID=A0A0E9T690_ANGAN
MRRYTMQVLLSLAVVLCLQYKKSILVHVQPHPLNPSTLHKVFPS